MHVHVTGLGIPFRNRYAGLATRYTLGRSMRIPSDELCMRRKAKSYLSGSNIIP
ncbi:hypothetical protein G5B00_01760 [Parapedobacter sp. SGR-10]|uniref:hypothetical protein n=1 Tax=Parapedobacter sp. SGR-10 TaxID=2710879 RepID=UPI0013D62453|nr:hypothetical protein [Parapedobacter sp. SGR-10]NGF55226.1 hypothetical protein [Parapedobacter sp. SGR-10]